MNKVKFSLVLFLMASGVYLESDKARLMKLLENNKYRELIEIQDLCRRKSEISTSNNSEIDQSIFSFALVILDDDLKAHSSFLGRGGFGRVFKTTYAGKPAAVKIVEKSRLNLELASKEMYYWLKMWLTYSGDVIEYFDCVHDTKHMYIIQGLMQMDLYKFGHMHFTSRSLSDLDRYWIMYRMATAVGHMHKNKMVHYDLKPDNFMISESSSPRQLKSYERFDVRIIDFGFTSPASFTYFKGGTSGYKSPETHEGRNTSSKSDIFSLGMTYWKLFYDRLFSRPFCENIRVKDTYCENKLVANLKAVFNTEKNFATGYPRIGALIEEMTNFNYDARIAIDKVIDTLKKEIESISPNFFSILNPPPKPEEKKEAPSRGESKDKIDNNQQQLPRSDEKNKQTPSNGKDNKIDQRNPAKIDNGLNGFQLQTQQQPKQQTQEQPQQQPKQQPKQQVQGTAQPTNTPLTKPINNVYRQKQQEKPFQLPQPGQADAAKANNDAQVVENKEAPQKQKLRIFEQSPAFNKPEVQNDIFLAKERGNTNENKENYNNNYLKPEQKFVGEAAKSKTRNFYFREYQL